MQLPTLPITQNAFPVYDRDLWEWDRCVWSLMQQLADCDPAQAGRAFGMGSDSARAVAELSTSQLDRLASGIFVSFYPDLEISRAAEAISQPFELTTNVRDGSLDSDYWMLLAQAGRANAPLSALKFGVEPHMVELFSQCSLSQIRQAVSQFSSNFKLRFPPGLLLEYIDSDTPQRLMMRKLALTLTYTKN